MQKEKQDSDKRLQKDKQDADKKLADTEQREKQEREAKDKLEQEKRLWLAREQAAKDEAQRAKLERERLAEGPAMPANLMQKLTCATPDENPPGADVHVHCAAQPQLKAEEITLYYRPSGSARYHTFAMARTRKGWAGAMIPAALIKGSMLQYYVEALSERGRVVATNGKPAFPNVVMVNRYPSRVAAAASAPSGGLVKARARSRTRSP